MADAQRTFTRWASLAAVWLAGGSAYAQSDSGSDALPPASPPSSPEDAGGQGSAAEPPAPPFGAPGQFMISGASSAGVSYRTYSGSQAQSIGVSLSPALDYFFVRNVAAGVDLSASYSDGQGYGSDGSLVETKATGFSAGARLGVNVPLGPIVSVFPRVTLGFEWARTEESVVSGQSLSVAGNPVGYPTTTRSGPYAILYVPVLVHPAPHFFIGGGPSLFRDFGSVQGGPDIGGQRTRVGVAAVVGGTWGGSLPVTPALAPDETPPVRPRRFGEAGEFVFDAEIDVSLLSTTYDGTQSSSLSFGLQPSFDYFVADHVSLGVAPFLTYSQISGVDAATGARVQTTATGAGIEPRVGYHVPLASWLSWYPRAGLAFGGSAFDETSAGSENKYSTGFVTFEAYAPLLVHPAPHVLAGFGPSIDADITHSYSSPQGVSVQNLATAVGAALTVGGWL